MFWTAAVDLAWVAQGRLDAAIMLSITPSHSSAGVIIAREAGALVLDLTGEQHTTQSKATVAVASTLIERILDLIRHAALHAYRPPQRAVTS